MELNKHYYVVCPLYKAKKRYKVADRKHFKKTCKYEILECELLVHRKELDDMLVKIIDNDEQHEFTHHKNLMWNKIYVDESSVKANKNDLLPLWRVCNEVINNKNSKKEGK